MLLLATWVSLVGTEFTEVALPFQIFQHTHPPLANGLLGLAQIGPVLLLRLLGGVLADARDRRNIHLRGRLASIELLSDSSGPLLGNVESCVVSSLARVRNAVWSGGLLPMAGAVAVAPSPTTC